MVDSYTVDVIVVMGFVISTVCPLKIKQHANDSWADLCPMGVNYHQWTLSLAATHSFTVTHRVKLPKLCGSIVGQRGNEVAAKKSYGQA